MRLACEHYPSPVKDTAAPTFPAASTTSPSVLPVLSVVAGVLTAGVVLLVAAGGLVTRVLAPAGLLWPFYGVVAVSAVLLALGSRSWRAAPVVGFVIVWAVLGASLPYALRVAPDPVLATKEARGLAECALLSGAALAAGLRGGLRAWRAGWLGALVLTCAIGTWELLTDQHLWVTAAKPWPFHGRVAAATFVNPNNFGIAVLSMLVGVLAWRASTPRRAIRWALTVAAVWAAVLVVASQSRSAVLGLVLVAAVHAVQASRSRPGLLRAALTRHRRAVFSVGAGAFLLLAATFVVPPLAARNPVLAMIRAALQPETAASDMLRVNLIRAGLRYWRESGYLGTGAGSFEPIMWNDPHSGVAIKANLHNGFVELLVQYGWVVAVPLLALLVLLVGVAVRTRANAALRPQVGIVRTEMLGHLVAYVALGFTASSSLALPIWWLMLAAACACAAWLLAHTRPGLPGRRTHRVAARTPESAPTA